MTWSSASRLERLDGCRIEREPKRAALVDEAEEDRLGGRRQARAPRASVNSGSSPAAVFLQHDQLAADRVGPGARRRSRSAASEAASVRRSAARSIRLAV